MPPAIQASADIERALARPPGYFDSDSDAKAEVAMLPQLLAAIRPVIEAAASKLDLVQAWPSHAFSPYHIELGFGESIEVRWGPLNAMGKGIGRSLTINPDDPLRIAVGVRLLNSPRFLGLMNLMNATDVDTCALLLAHETFHLREADNMSLSGIPHTDTKSGFARAAHPGFSAPWRDAILALAAAFPAQRDASDPYPPKKSLAVWKAADIASEACADLLALRLLAPPLFNQQALTQGLTADRQQQEAEAVAMLPDASGQVANPQYQVGAVLANAAPALLAQDEWAIREAMWRESFQAVLAEQQYLAHDVREKIIEAQKHPAKAPTPPPKKSFLSRWFTGQ